VLQQDHLLEVAKGPEGCLHVLARDLIAQATYKHLRLGTHRLLRHIHHVQRENGA
jgi:hypothetical protein